MRRSRHWIALMSRLVEDDQDRCTPLEDELASAPAGAGSSCTRSHRPARWTEPLATAADRRAAGISTCGDAPPMDRCPIHRRR